MPLLTRVWPNIEESDGLQEPIMPGIQLKQQVKRMLKEHISIFSSSSISEVPLPDLVL